MSTKICKRCNQELSTTSFYKYSYGDVCRTECKKCFSRARAKRRNEYKKEMYTSDEKYRLICRLRARTRAALRISGSGKHMSTMSLLGLSVIEFKAYIESTFQKGMTWDNMSMWHIDHIKPCCSFNLSSPEQQKECFHYTNLRALWKFDNLKKVASDLKMRA